MPKLNLEEIANGVKAHENKVLTAEKVGELREEITAARKYQDINENDFSLPNKLTYEHLNKSAYLSDGHYLGRGSDLSLTTKKLVIASDYLSQGKESEACAVLGNAFEKFSHYARLNFPGSNRRELEKQQQGGVYEAIEQRALRGAKKTYTQDIKLGKEFVELAEKANEAYTHLRKS